MTARRARPARAALAVAVGVLGLVLAAPGSLPGARAADPEIDRPPASRPAAAELATDATPRLVWHGPRTERVVALTFDDGYGPATVRRIFQVLRREKVPATFFVNGVYIKQDPDLWRRIAAAGYPIGNHTYLHRDVTTLTASEIARDLARTRKVVEAATGRPMLPYFRPPYGARNAATDRAAAAAGFPVTVMWDVTGGDTVRPTTVGTVVARAAAGRPGSIVVLHAGPTVTPRALPAIIARYRERGFRFVTVPELLGEPQAVAASTPGPTLAPTPTPTPMPTPMPTPTPTPTPAAALAAPATPPPTAGPRPAAREAAWARRDETPAMVAGGTAIGLLLLVLTAAAAGRTRARETDGPG